MIDTLKSIYYYSKYLVRASFFELVISILFLLIGMLCFENIHYYYFFVSAILGGLWSYRLNQIYKRIREPLGNDKRGKPEFVKDYFQKKFGTDNAFWLRQRLAKYVSLIDIVLFLIIWFL